MTVMVLVHGGGLGASCWDRLLPFLEGEVLAVDLPGRGSRPADLMSLTIADFVDAVVTDIETAGFDDVTLVGHSLAGITLPGVAERIGERLRRLVFISCSVPPSGHSILDTLDNEDIRAVAEKASRQQPQAMPADLAVALFCNDMTPEQTAYTTSLLCPEAPAVTTEAVSLTGLDQAIPRTWIRLLRDRIVEPAKQDRFVEIIGGAEVIDLDAGHMAMISAPAELAKILNTL